jgi:hypothetical protein
MAPIELLFIPPKPIGFCCWDGLLEAHTFCDPVGGGARLNPDSPEEEGVVIELPAGGGARENDEPRESLSAGLWALSELRDMLDMELVMPWPNAEPELEFDNVED